MRKIGARLIRAANWISDLCEKCNIKSVPTFILFKNKQEIGQCKGANIVPVAELIKPYC